MHVLVCILLPCVCLVIISKWLEKLHINPVSILPYRTVLKNTHLLQVGGSGSTYLFIMFPSMHYFWHIIKGKLGSDVGQPGILTGDIRVSHTHPSDSCGTPWYHQLEFLVTPHPNLAFLYYLTISPDRRFPTRTISRVIAYVARPMPIDGMYITLL